MVFSDIQKRRQEPNPLKGMVAGAAAGLVASYVMNQFQVLLSQAASKSQSEKGARSSTQSLPNHGIGRYLDEHGAESGQDDAATRLGTAVSLSVADRPLTKDEKQTAGAAVHYAFGGSTGALYGLAAERFPSCTAGLGLPMGAFVWMTADEMGVPAAGLSKAPTEYPLSSHASALASHLVYGLTTEVARRIIRRLLK